MIRSFTLCLLLLFAATAHADYWDNMTREEAEMVLIEVKKNPFVFAYCDCCGDAMELVKITAAEIEVCSWDAEQFSVHYTFVPVASFVRKADRSLSAPSKPSQEIATNTIFMNYTWTVDPETKKAAPFFKAIPYHYYENSSCEESFDYPSPKSIKKIYKNKDYAGWYKEIFE